MLPASLKTRLNNWAERLRGSQWLVPVLFSIGAIGAAELALQLDIWAESRGEELPWPIYAGNASAARQLLGTLAGAMVSLTTLTFSVTMIVLTLATNQFGPRLLRNFLQDRFNQSVFGAFVAAFLYCLLVLGHLPGGGGLAACAAPGGHPRVAVRGGRDVCIAGVCASHGTVDPDGLRRPGGCRATHRWD